MTSGVLASGRLGAMVRMRGVGTVTVSVGRSTAPLASPLGDVSADANEEDFVEQLMASASGSLRYAWTSDADAPRTLEVRTHDGAFVEIDCVVPFVTP